MWDLESKKSFLFTFANTVLDYLKSIVVGEEKILENGVLNEDGVLFTAPLGIRELKIGPRSNILVKYFENFSSFKEYILYNNGLNLDNLVIIVNLEKRFAEIVNSKKRIIYLDELDPKKRLIKDTYKSDSFIKNKCIPIDEIDEYLAFLFRIKFLSSFFINSRRNEIVSEDFIKNIGMKNENTVFPFSYKCYGTHYVFFEYKKDIEKEYESLLHLSRENEEVVFEQVSFDRYNNPEFEVINVTVSEKEVLSFERHLRSPSGKIVKFEMQKVGVSDLLKNATIFTKNRKYLLMDFETIFKYRQFGKTRYSKKEEKIDYTSTPHVHSDSYEICVGSRSAIEQSNIWFSTYEGLNDPFDMTIREPIIKRVKTPIETIFKTISYNTFTDTGISVFCTTKKNDNILMWSHYADSHKGMCTAYSQNELLDEISKDNSVSICFYGDVDYIPPRPQFRITATLLRYFGYVFLYTVFNIKNLFHKYEDWSYEAERRFIIFPIEDYQRKFISDKGHAMHLDVKNYIFGYNFPKTKFNAYLLSFGITKKVFHLSNDDYKLLP